MVQRLAAAGVIAGLAGVLALAAEDSAGGAPVKIVALGDSLVAGYGLPANAAFPVQLEKALNAKDVAVEIANATTFGLSSSLWSSDDDEIDWFIDRLEAGAVFVNGMTVSHPELPFGGIKNSGVGRELAAAGIREFMNLKTVCRA